MAMSLFEYQNVLAGWKKFNTNQSTAEAQSSISEEQYLEAMSKFGV